MTPDHEAAISPAEPRQPEAPAPGWNRYDDPILKIHREMHARVSVPVAAPCRIRHSAYLLPGEGRESQADVRGRFEEVAARLGIGREAIRWGERSGEVTRTLPGGRSLRIVWELHTEFYSFTTYHAGPPAVAGDEAVEPFTFPALPPLGAKLVDMDVLVVPGLELGEVAPSFLHPGTIYGGSVLQGAARVWTTFQVDENGQGRVVVGAGELPPGRLGRLIRRLVEIENYYHLILLPQEEYRGQERDLHEMERRIALRSEDIAAELSSREPRPGHEHRWLVYLTRDLAELIRLTERMRYRLSAADSYYAIFEERLHWLREETGEGYQSIEEFLRARVGPAVRSYRNFIARSDALGGQLTSLGNMMRTRVNLSMEEQSLETLKVLNRRVELQLMLQRTVEGLSIVVLAYYFTGLAGHIVHAVGSLWHLPLPEPVLTALTIPVWLLVGWGVTHRIKRLVKHFAPPDALD
ncbi:MAG TPA: DUF3422 domain-containing protein [bacterium]|nr:DUF3422 domain-containing protein [bacterium]